MTWPGVDYHTHICESSFDAMLASAAAYGVREYGIAEHIFQLHEGYLVFPDIVDEGICFLREWYVETCRDWAKRSAFGVLLGLEVDYVPGTEGAVAHVLDGVEWDFLIGSIHTIDGVDLFSYQPVDAAEGERLWRRYDELAIAAVESGVFDILSHPVRSMVYNPHVPDDVDDVLVALAQVAVRGDVALELNGDDTSRWPEMVTRLARACERAGCSISLGSDAHRPDTVAQCLQEASTIAFDAGIQGVVSFHRRNRRMLRFN